MTLICIISSFLQTEIKKFKQILKAHSYLPFGCL